MFDEIYNKSEIIFMISSVLSNKWDWLMFEFNLYVQYFHFQLHCCMFLTYGSGFTFFASDELIDVKSVKNHFTRSYHARWRMKYYSSYRLWFNFDKPSKEKQSCHCMILLSEQGVILFYIRFFSYLLSENKFLCLLNATT